MSSSVHSSLPGPALQASKAALNAALADIESSEPDEVQEIEVDMALQAETLKTVFNDPKNFNVKVRVFPRFFLFSFGREDSRCLSLSLIWWLIFRSLLSRIQHPLYSAWTLWFDSPATKGRNLPQTPMTAFPQTPHPPTPGGAAAHGWMEDIKRVINIDSVEEFWG